MESPVRPVEAGNLVLLVQAARLSTGGRYIDWSKRWRKAYKTAKVSPAPRLRLRHTFASLLLAEGRTGHYMAEFEDRMTVKAEDEIRTARDDSGATTGLQSRMATVAD